MKDGRIVAVRSMGTLFCVLLLICFGAMGQGCGIFFPPADNGDTGGGGDDGDGDDGGGTTPPATGNSGVTGQFVSAQKTVVVDSATDDVRVGCGFCHPGVHDEWLTTNHATALETLEAIGQGSNATCLECHTVGFGQSGGFVDRATTDALAGVQCENCHGPGAQHVSDIMDPALRPPAGIAMLDPNICGKCHNDFHHPTFDEYSESAHAGGEFWEADAPELLERGNRCGVCHSGDIWQLGRVEGETITDDILEEKGLTVEDLHPIVCATCHDPHVATGNGAQLRYAVAKVSSPSNTIAGATDTERFGICGQCHHSRGKVYTGTGPHGAAHHSIQNNMLLGEMPVPDGEPALVTSIQSKHTFASKQCVTCHMYPEEKETPTEENPNNTGHTFEVRFTGCADQGCHGDSENMAQRVSSRKSVTESGLDQIKAALDDWSAQSGLDWEYGSDDEDSLPPNVMKARFMYYYIINDMSGGVHNFKYVDQIITEARLRAANPNGQ